MQLIVSKVSHRFADLEVLQDIDLTVGPGEIVAIVGPSGCGKSTLLAIVGGLLQPSGGQVLLRGEAPDGCLNPVTFVFQDFSLLPWRSVAENVAFALEHRRLPGSEQAAIVADVLQRTGLGDFAQALPKQLSGGMRQRVGIARALATRPALLLLDEPLSALDAQTRELLMEDFAGLLASERTGALYVTHNLDEAIHLADRVVVLSRRPGRVRQVLVLPVPRGERRGPVAQAALAETRQELWSLIRDGALAAEREIARV